MGGARRRERHGMRGKEKGNKMVRPMIWRGNWRPFRNGGLEGYAKCRPISGPTGVIFFASNL
jgi:hypothetical protein